MLWTVCNLVLSVAVLAAAEPSPTGLWITVDDKSHKPRGTVRIYEQNGVYLGRIESSFNPADRTDHCDKCTDDRKDAPIIGLVIMRGVTKHGDEYTGGNILDPDTGSIYRCRFTMSPDGQKLFLRGYLGVSLLGRTQTWTRAPE